MKQHEAHKFIVDKIKGMTPKLAFDVEQDYTKWRKEAKERLEDLQGI